MAKKVITYKTEAVIIASPKVMPSGQASASPQRAGPPIDFQARQDRIGLKRRTGGAKVDNRKEAKDKPSDVPETEVSDK